jgi:5-methylcytosine-specific restriction protein A
MSPGTPVLFEKAAADGGLGDEKVQGDA